MSLTMSEKFKREIELEQKVRQAATAYYLHEPIISDSEFDSLLKELQTVNPHNEILKLVGYGGGTGKVAYGDEIELPVKIQYSLPKIFDVAEYADKLESDCDSLILAPKVDGLSVILHYSNDNFSSPYQLMTRGDGVRGINITPKISYIPDVMQCIKTLNVSSKLIEPLYIRGELFIKKSVFEKHFSKDYKNPHNCVAGIVNRKYFKDLEHVSFFPFDITSFGGHTRTGISANGTFKRLGVKSVFDGAMFISSRLSAYELNDLTRNYYGFLKTSSDIPVDGVVLNGEVAWKAENESVPAIVDRVEWTTSDKSRIIPVVVLKEPGVELYGTTVRRLSGFNYSYVDSNKIGYDSELLVTKANEIIPYIDTVVSASPTYQELTECPTCKGSIEKDSNETHMMCQGSCVDRMYIALESFFNMFVCPKGFKETGRLLGALDIRSPERLNFLLTFPSSKEVIDILSPIFGPYRTGLVIESIKNWPLKIPVGKFLQSLGIPDIGEAASQEIGVNKKQLETCVFTKSIPESVRINYLARKSFEIHHRIIYEFYNWFHEFLKDHESQTTSSQKVCVTGKMNFGTRNEFAVLLQSHGVIVIDKLDKNTILITNDKETNSSKMKKAKSLGIEILSEEEAVRRFIH